MVVEQLTENRTKNCVKKQGEDCSSEKDTIGIEILIIDFSEKGEWGDAMKKEVGGENRRGDGCVDGVECVWEISVTWMEFGLLVLEEN